MKCKRIKKHVQLGILLFGITLFLFNCEKETSIEHLHLEVDSGDFKQRFVSISEIPKVKNYFETTIKNDVASRTDDEQETNPAIFDEEHILEVIDTLQNTNYSFRFTFANTPLNEFYNLIIGKNAEGELQTPSVLKYVADEDCVEELVAHDFDFDYFKGTVSLHKYTDFFELGHFDRTPCPVELDAVGDPIPCIINPVRGNNSGGGGGSTGNAPGPGTTGAGSGPAGTGAGGTSGYNVSLSCTCVGHTETQIENGECNCSTYVIEINRPSSGGGKNRTTDDCPDCSTGVSGGVGINPTSITSIRSTLKSKLRPLSTEQFNYINNDQNTADVLNIYALLVQYSDIQGNFTTPTINFVKDAIDALIEGINVNFEELYIAYPTPDDDYEYIGPKALIPNPLPLSNGTYISITFGTTSDQINANQPISIDLIEGMKFALEEANSLLPVNEQITSIHIAATTNGHGSPGSSNSNHLTATAIDISRINGEKMILSGLTNQITQLQIAFDNFQYIRENYGPYFMHKYYVESDTWNYNVTSVKPHKDHIHISVRR